jgi:hypothetical protein
LSVTPRRCHPCQVDPLIQHCQSLSHLCPWGTSCCPTQGPAHACNRACDETGLGVCDDWHKYASLNNPKFNNPKFNNPKFNNPKFNNPKFNNPKFNNPKFKPPSNDFFIFLRVSTQNLVLIVQHLHPKYSFTTTALVVKVSAHLYSDEHFLYPAHPGATPTHRISSLPGSHAMQAHVGAPHAHLCAFDTALDTRKVKKQTQVPPYRHPKVKKQAQVRITFFRSAA